MLKLLCFLTKVSYILIFKSDSVLSNNAIVTSAISTEGCVIPGFPLVSEEIRDIVDSPEITHNCSTNIPLVYSNSSHIWLNHDAFDYYNIWTEDLYCCYKNFSAENNFRNISYGACTQFSTCIEIEHNFVRVECYYSDKRIYDDFIITIKHITRAERNTVVSSPSIIILGMDGMSRINFLRTMPKTSKYLRDRGSIQLLGYNKVGDNTFPNMFPLMMGQSFEKAKRFCKNNNVINTDKCPFMWDRYKAAGYSTALGSDSTGGLFNAYERRLAKFPTDFYLQPFMYETRTIFRDKKYNFHICLHNKYFYKILLNYAKQLLAKLRTRKTFAFFWEETISHENLNLPHIMDKDYADLIGRLDNSVVILVSDHGKRFGKIALTQQGRFESRLPLLEVVFPERFRRRYKLAHKNFENNRHRLTTPYDIYETLLDLINPTLLQDHVIKERTRTLNVNANRMSLFLPIPGNRTCETVEIDSQWCTCHKENQKPARPKVKLVAARYLVSHINKILTKFPQCHELEIDRIVDVSVMQIANHSRTYSVVVQTRPGAGIFDGTLVWQRGLWAVAGSVTRLNLYRDQSRCLTNVLAKMFCFCK